MSKSNNTAPKANREEGTAVHEEPASGATLGPVDVETGGNLDKVREILFGAQVRESEKRQQRHEERILKELSDIREDIRRRYESLDTFVRQELDSLSERVAAERAQRLESQEATSREHKEYSSTIQKKLVTADEQLSKVQRDLRQQILDSSTRSAEDLRVRSEEISSLVSRAVDELRADKASRSAIAALFGEMAMRLSSDPTE